MNRKERRNLKKDKNLVKELYSIIAKYLPELLTMFDNLTDVRHKSYVTYTMKTICVTRLFPLLCGITTMTDISKLCGNQQTEKGIEPLITVEDLKLLNNFEAVILIPRINPIKSKLLPDYQIDWKFNDEKVVLKEIENKEVKTFSLE